jgi:Ran GTPase-activating protein (RanGAP) involved in mRNA processing and transport
VQLDLSSNSISTTGGAALISSLETNNSLLNLNLSSYEGLSRNTLGPNGVKPLKFVLKINRYLAILSLAGNFIGDTGVGYLCEGLEGNTTLMELNLAQNEITSEGVEIMEKGFKHTEIQILNLTRNPIKNKGAKSIANMIMRGSDVKIDDLNLTECQITYQGAVSIFLSLKRSNELTKLTLDGNNLHNKYMAELS